MPRNTSGLRRGGPGRPKGVPNRATREFKAFWRCWMDSADYRENVKRRILLGRAPHLESYIAQMVYGRPKDVVETQGELVIRCEMLSDCG